MKVLMFIPILLLLFWRPTIAQHLSENTFLNQQLAFQLTTGKSSQSVKLATSISDWSPDKISLTEIKNGVYQVIIPTPWTHSFNYKFVVNGIWTEDPNCTDKVSDGLGGFNCRILTGFQENVLLLDPKFGYWIKTETNIDGYPVVVLRPPFDTFKKLPTLYFQDGADYLDRANLLNIITNYYKLTGIAFVAVLVSPLDRMKEYGSISVNEYDLFLSHKLVLVIENSFQTGGSPEQRLLIGPSMGGLATLRASLYTKTFGYAAPQSGSFWYIDDKLKEFVNLRKNNPKIFLIHGYFEGDGITGSNLKLKSILEKENLIFQFKTTPSRHDWLAWRNQLQQILDWYSKNLNYN